MEQQIIQQCLILLSELNNMGGNYRIFKHGIENKFPTYSVAHVTTGTGTIATVTVTIGGAWVKDTAPCGDVYAAYKNLWDRFNGSQGEVKPSLTQTQIDNLTSIDDGVSVVNKDTGGVETCKKGSFSNSSANPRTRPTKYEATTDATQTTIDSFTLVDDSVCIVTIHVTAIEYDGSDRGAWIYTAAVYRDGGNATFQGELENSLAVFSDSLWKVAITVSGNNVRASVTGAASQTIYWSCSMEIMES